MKKKYLFIIFVLVLFSLTGLFFSLQYVKKQSVQNMRGQYTFAKSKEKINQLSKIKITSPENGEINLYMKDGLWRIKEAQNYFVNADAIANLYQMINFSIITDVNKGSKQDYINDNLISYQETKDIKKSKGTEIEIYDTDNNLLNDVIIGNPVGENNFAKIDKNSAIFNISKANNIANSLVGWVPYPLLKISNTSVNAITIDGKYFDTNLLDIVVPQSETVKNAINTFQYLNYAGLVTNEEFFQKFSEVQPHKISLMTTIGLIYNFDIYQVNNQYWVKIVLEHTRVPVKDVISFVEDNQAYFSDWLFLMDNKQGELLYNIDLHGITQDNIDI